MDLYVIRHAWAGHYGDPDWPNDALRPLTPEGRERFVRMVAELLQRGFAPKLIATSPMVRCRQTAEVVASVAGGNAEVIQLDELLPGGDLEALLAWTAKQAQQHDQIAWVGHAPDVGTLAAELIDHPDGWIRFAKGAVAAIHFHEAPQIADGQLRWLLTAKLLGC